MADLILPAETDLALALREPNLLVPGRPPVGNVQLDYKNKICRDIYDFWVLNNKYTRSVSGKHAVNLGNQSTATNEYVETSYNLSSAGVFLGQISGLASFSGLTILFSVRNFDPTTSNRRLVSFTFSGGDDFRVLLTTPGLPTAWRVDWDDGTFTQRTYTVDTQSKWNNVAMSTDGTSVSFAVNGRVLTYKASETVNFASANGSFYINGNANEATMSQVRCAGILKRALSLSELVEITRNPYQLLKPANSTPYLISVPTGGATVTLSSPTATATGTTTATVGCTVTYA